MKTPTICRHGVTVDERTDCRACIWEKENPQNIFTPPKKEEPATPGPWFAYPENDSQAITKDDETQTGEWKEEYGLQVVLSSSERLSVKVADLRLMAAAPELLEALELLWAFIDDLGKSNPGFLGKLVLQDYAQMNQSYIKTEKILSKIKNP